MTKQIKAGQHKAYLTKFKNKFIISKQNEFGETEFVGYLERSERTSRWRSWSLCGYSSAGRRSIVFDMI